MYRVVRKFKFRILLLLIIIFHSHVDVQEPLFSQVFEGCRSTKGTDCMGWLHREFCQNAILQLRYWEEQLRDLKHTHWFLLQILRTRNFRGGRGWVEGMGRLWVSALGLLRPLQESGWEKLVESNIAQPLLGITWGLIEIQIMIL